MKRTKIADAVKKTGDTVKIFGRAETIRDHGKILFVDVADDSGLVQTVSKQQLNVSSQDVVAIEGIVKKRPANLINKELKTGEIEIEIKNLKVISASDTPPIPREGDGYDIEEDLRLKYRYLDLRRPRLQKNLRLRHQIVTIVRDFLNKEGFIEVETPYLSKTTPEGARDFITPSRLHPGKFYALAQAPQQYKQLLMLANFEKYYQIARAFRDEDMRADRQFEHSQIDIEMAYISREDVLSLIEKMMTDLAKNLKREIFKKPFPIFTFDEAVKKFKSDKFDLRKNPPAPKRTGTGPADVKDNTLAFGWVVDYPLFEFDKKQNRLTFSHNPFTAPKENEIEKLKKHQDLQKIKSYQFDLVLNGEELGSGSIRITDPKIQREIFKIMGFSDKKIDEDFGHLLNAYKYGAPPHGGIAIGLDRLSAIFAGESNIREVIAFPVSGGGQTSVMEAPSDIDESLLKELHIKKS